MRALKLTFRDSERGHNRRAMFNALSKLSVDARRRVIAIAAMRGHCVLENKPLPFHVAATPLPSLIEPEGAPLADARLQIRPFVYDWAEDEKVILGAIRTAAQFQSLVNIGFEAAANSLATQTVAGTYNKYYGSGLAALINPTAAQIPQSKDAIQSQNIEPVSANQSRQSTQLDIEISAKKGGLGLGDLLARKKQPVNA